MKVDDLFPSQYLKQSDVPRPLVGTIQSIKHEEIQDKGAKKMKPILYITGAPKPLVLNRVNAQSIASIYGDDSNNWIGKPIEIYTDPTVMMGRDRVGGLRLRAPQQINQHSNPFAAGQTTQNGFGNGPLWDISDGKQLIQKQTTTQVEAAIQELLDQHIPLNTHKVRAHPSGNPVTADVWLQQLQAGRPAAAADLIPF